MIKSLLIALSLFVSVAQADVTILDVWAYDSTYNDDTTNFTISAGTNRALIVFISAEHNNAVDSIVNNMWYGGKVITEVIDTIGDGTSEYHNHHWVGIITETDIASRTGDAITIDWAVDPSQPYGEVVIWFGSYENVDITTPIEDSDFNWSTANVSSRQILSSITSTIGSQILCFNNIGQPNTPSMTEVGSTFTSIIEFIGPSNAHGGEVYDKDSTAAATVQPTCTVAAATREACSCIAVDEATAGAPARQRLQVTMR